jgi:mono/diheme cytochrome c family protein
MRKQIVILSVLFLAAVAAVSFAFLRRDAPRRRGIDKVVADAQYHSSVLPAMKQYCWDCHGDGEDKGGVNFDSYTNINTLLADRSMWERVLHNVRSGDMPPKKKKTQPTEAERTNLVAWLDNTLFPVDLENPDPGRVTIRRLNRVEYNNTIRDLVGVDFEPAADFPQDDVGYGFDNIGDVLSMPPILLERYLKAAESVLDEALVTGPLPPKTRRFSPDKIKGHVGGSALATLSSNGEMYVDYDARVGAEYVFKVRAYGDQAGDEKVKMALRADGKDLEEIEIRRGRGNSKTVEHRVKLERGNHRLGVAFLNDFYLETEIAKTNARGRITKEKKIQDRNLQVEVIEVVGPFSDEVPPLPASHRRIFTKKPGPKTTNEVAREIISSFAGRAFRRPATTSEVARLMTLTQKALESGENFEASVKYALTAVLVSPHFLFRGELQPDPDNPSSVHKVNEYALASRLSYFLWSSMPDEELFQMAANGRLRKNLDAQIKRMIADPKARALVDNFAGQWLQLRTMEIIAPDSKLFPGFDDDLRESARRETEKLFEYVLREDRPVTEFLTADYTFVNERLAKHYGIDGVKGSDFVKVSLQGTPRGGVLTHASFLALTSNPTRTSPVKRGKWVLENILASPPPPPPPNVPPLDGKELKGTLRQRMDEHRANAVCASCHAKMDPIGFAFEHFDAVGRYRDKDGSEVIDATGVLTSGEAFDGHSQLNKVLAGSRRDDFIRCLSEKMLTYALGRGLEYYDRPAVDLIKGRLEKDGLKFSTLIRSVVDSVPFQMRRGDGDPLLADAR